MKTPRHDSDVDAAALAVENENLEAEIGRLRRVLASIEQFQAMRATTIIRRLRNALQLIEYHDAPLTYQDAADTIAAMQLIAKNALLLNQDATAADVARTAQELGLDHAND